jgi:hypothetical protein
LFLGASLDAAGDGRADGVLAEAAGRARQTGAVPLLWVAEALLATRARRRGDTRDWIARLASSRAAVTQIGRALAPDDRKTWLNRPDIVAILRPGPDGDE